MGVADGAHARLHRVDAVVRPGGSTARTPRRGRAGWRGRGRSPRRRAAASSPPRNSSVPWPTCSRVQRAAVGRVRRRSRRCRCARAPRGRGCRPGRGRSARGQLHALVGVRAVAHEVAQAPDARRGPRPPRPASTAWKAGRLPCTSESTAILRGSPLLSGAWAVNEARLSPALAGDGRRGRGGNAGPAAPERPDRAGRRRADSVLQPAELERAADFRDLQRVLGLAGLALSGGDARRAGAAPAARVRLLDSGGARAARPRGRDRAGAGGGGPAARRSGATSGRSTWASPPSRWARGWRRGQVGRHRRRLRRARRARW